MIRWIGPTFLSLLKFKEENNKLNLIQLTPATEIHQSIPTQTQTISNAEIIEYWENLAKIWFYDKILKNHHSKKYVKI